MVARKDKSKRRSAGKDRSPQPPDSFVLYLDENLCNSKAILDVLSRLSIRYERHLAHFPVGTPDQDWLPKVGENEWVLLTADKRIRCNYLEKEALAEHRVKEFVFVSGNLSGADMATALENAISKMVRLAKRVEPPFVAAITRGGEVHMRWPKE